jgi:hypothetical protein
VYRDREKGVGYFSRYIASRIATLFAILVEIDRRSKFLLKKYSIAAVNIACNASSDSGIGATWYYYLTNVLDPTQLSAQQVCDLYRRIHSPNSSIPNNPAPDCDAWVGGAFGEPSIRFGGRVRGRVLAPDRYQPGNAPDCSLVRTADK